MFVVFAQPYRNPKLLTTRRRVVSDTVISAVMRVSLSVGMDTGLPCRYIVWMVRLMVATSKESSFRKVVGRVSLSGLAAAMPFTTCIGVMLHVICSSPAIRMYIHNTTSMHNLVVIYNSRSGYCDNC
jgi:hypothetical protein